MLEKLQELSPSSVVTSALVAVPIHNRNLLTRTLGKDLGHTGYPEATDAHVLRRTVSCMASIQFPIEPCRPTWPAPTDARVIAESVDRIQALHDLCFVAQTQELLRRSMQMQSKVLPFFAM